MSRKRILLSEPHVRGSGTSRRRREEKFLRLALFLALLLAAGFGAILWTLNAQGRL